MTWFAYAWWRTSNKSSYWQKVNNRNTYSPNIYKSKQQQFPQFYDELLMKFISPFKGPVNNRTVANLLRDNWALAQCKHAAARNLRISGAIMKLEGITIQLRVVSLSRSAWPTFSAAQRGRRSSSSQAHQHRQREVMQAFTSSAHSQQVSKASSTCRSCHSNAVRKRGARARQLCSQLDHRRANAPFYGVEDQSAKPVLRNVGHGQHYVTSRQSGLDRYRRGVRELFRNASVCVVRSAVIFIKYDCRSLLYELVTLFWKSCLLGCDDISWRKVNKCLRKRGLALPHVHLKEHFHFFQLFPIPQRHGQPRNLKLPIL